MPVEMELAINTVQTPKEKAYATGRLNWEWGGEDGVANPFADNSELWDAWNQGYWDAAAEQYG